MTQFITAKESNQQIENETDFAQITNESSDIVYTDISKTKAGSYILINNRPCRITNKVTVKNGKHGHSKSTISASDIFTGKQVQMSYPSGQDVPVPNVVRSSWSVMNIEGEDLSLCNTAGLTDYSLRLPSGKLGDDILKAFNNADENNTEVIVTVLSCGDEKQIIEMHQSE